MTCSIVPFEEEASSVTTKKKSRRTPFNNREQLVAAKRCTAAIPGVQLPFHLTAGLCLLLHKMQVSSTMCSTPASEFCLTDQ
ncbi:hypothetical protein HGM15179_014312, partial [Zosterops borbonicus]